MGGQIVSFEDEIEHHTFEGKIYDNIFYWTGINRLADPGSTVSLASGKHVKSLDFNKDEPEIKHN